MKIFIKTSGPKQEATAAGLSDMQLKYRAFMKAKCEEAGRSHPFEGTPDEISDFMLSISEGWAEYKAKNGYS